MDDWRNRRGLDPREAEKTVKKPDAYIHGFAVALAEVHRLLLHGNDSAGVRKVACDGGLTLKVAKEAGCGDFDLKELAKAGVE